MTTALYGGSFNPIHLGHIALGEWLIGHHYADELWFLVSPQNPLKPVAGLLADDARLHLAHLAVAEATAASATGVAALCVSDFEFRLPRPSFMVHTLEALRATYPGREFLLVIGADNWQRFPLWHRADEILCHHRIIVYPRPGYCIEPTAMPPGITSVDAPLHDLSSTQIRDAIAHEANYRGEGLPASVWKEIAAKGYYRTALPDC